MGPILPEIRGDGTVLIVDLFDPSPGRKHAQRRVGGDQDLGGEQVAGGLVYGEPVAGSARRTDRPDLSFLVGILPARLDEKEAPAGLCAIKETHLKRCTGHKERVQWNHKRIRFSDPKRRVDHRRGRRTDQDAIDLQTGGKKQERVGDGVRRMHPQAGIAKDAACVEVEPQGEAQVFLVETRGGRFVSRAGKEGMIVGRLRRLCQRRGIQG